MNAIADTEPTVRRPVLIARKLKAFSLDDWAAARAGIDGQAPLELGQAWLPAPAEGFRPARVRVGWADDGLVVWAELDDVDIFNHVTKFNEPAFREGDAFELFLRPAGQEAYFEFHITPENQVFQLRIPGADYFKLLRIGGMTALESLKIPHPVVQSRVRVDRLAHRWSVLALVPFRAVIESRQPWPAGPWRFSFSRYDYTRGCPKPVISSTSPHPRADFHRQQEWGNLHFEK